MISIIIRTKNEERWIKPCLEKILKQKVKQRVEIILVDNNSSDQTVSRAKSICPELKLVKIKKFLPGLALNMGIRESSGDYIVCLSAHCPPANEFWLSNLLKNFKDKKIAGVYGRQLPTDSSSYFDKRDLLNTFGLDKRLQIRDTFFHNANSMIPRKIWDKFPFDENITNIEDRLWGQEVIKAGLRIIYEPDAMVFHYHGIHQDNRPDRASNVVRILENYVEDFNPDLHGNPFDDTSHEICAIIPLKGDKKKEVFEKKLLEITIQSFKQCKLVNRVIVATDKTYIADIATNMGAEVPFLRPKELSKSSKRVDDVLQYFISKLESEKYFPDIVLSAEVNFPFRPKGLIDGVINKLLKDSCDTVVAGLPEFRPCWKWDNGIYHQVANNLKQRKQREPLHIAVAGLICASWTNQLRLGNRLSGKIGIFETKDPLAGTEIRTNTDLDLIKKWISL